MNEAVLIQCVKSKQNEKLPAREIYDSLYFQSMKEFAQATGKPWYILSAKHGLLNPEREIKPYDAFGLSRTQGEEIAKQLNQMGVNKVTMVAGKKYTRPLKRGLEKSEIQFEDVGEGLGIGERVSLLQTETKKLKNRNLC